MDDKIKIIIVGLNLNLFKMKGAFL